MTRNALVTVSIPSVTSTQTRFVEGPCSSSGVHRNTPSTNSEPSGPSTTLRPKDCAGTSGSAPTKGNVYSAPSGKVTSDAPTKDGARFTSFTMTVNVLVEASEPSVATTRITLVDGPCPSLGFQRKTPFTTSDPVGPDSNE